jgi:hypothetical protein
MAVSVVCHADLTDYKIFLYWRYKSFPPYEGMDLPSWQQLTSFSNFGIIVFASVLLGLILVSRQFNMHMI